MEDKLKKVCNDFSKLNEEQQEYVLGIMQALVFAQNTQEQAKNVSHKKHQEQQLNAQRILRNV